MGEVNEKLSDRKDINRQKQLISHPMLYTTL
jgi:hypothetical protein